MIYWEILKLVSWLTVFLSFSWHIWIFLELKPLKRTKSKQVFLTNLLPGFLTKLRNGFYITLIFYQAYSQHRTVNRFADRAEYIIQLTRLTAVPCFPLEIATYWHSLGWVMVLRIWKRPRILMELGVRGSPLLPQTSWGRAEAKKVEAPSWASLRGFIDPVIKQKILGNNVKSL